MNLEITHPEKPTLQDKIDDNDYMLPHHLAGVLPDFSNFPGAKIRLPILIEEKIAELGTTELTFSGLNGDADSEYILKGEVTTAGMTQHTGIDLCPNNINTDQTGVRHNLWNSDHGYNSKIYRLQLFNNHLSNSVYGKFEAYFHSKTSFKRLLKSETVAVFTGDTIAGSNICIGAWHDTTTTVTSLVIKANTGSFSGTIKLYKLVEITLEDLST